MSARQIERWHVSSTGGAVCLTARRAASPAELARAWRPAEAARLLDVWFPAGAPGVSHAACFEIAARVGAGLYDDPSTARDRVRVALREGVVVAFRDARRDAYAPPPEEQTDAAPPLALLEERTWITIELVTNEDPPKPVPYERYSIRLPDGTLREGCLDVMGLAHVADLDPGTCEVMFPDLDGSEWKAL